MSVSSPRRDRFPSRSEFLKRLSDVVFLDGVTRGSEHVVLTLTPTISILEEVRKQDTSVRSRLLEWDLALVEKLYNGRTTDVQKIRCLLSRQPRCPRYD